MPITKQQLDESFNTNYNQWTETIKGLIIKNKSKLEPTILLSEAYINMINKLDVIEENKIPHFVMKFCNMQTTYKNVPANKENNFTSKGDNYVQTFTSKFFDVCQDTLDVYFNITDEEDVIKKEYEEDKDPYEYEYNSIKKQLQVFKKTLNVIDAQIADFLLIYIFKDSTELLFEKLNVTTITEEKFYKKQLRSLKNKFIEQITKNNWNKNKETELC